MRFAAVVLLAFLSTVSCSRRTSASEFGKIVEEFVYKTLSFSPVTASGQGLHKYNGEDFDRMLDDFSSRSIQAQRNYYVDLHKRLENFDKNSFSPEDRADYDIIDTQIGLALFDPDVAQILAAQSADLCGTAGFRAVQPVRARVRARARTLSAHHRAAGKDPAIRQAAARQLAQVPPSGRRWRRRRTTATSI